MYLGITAFIALFGTVYEQFSHNVYSFHMWFAWIYPLIFGLVPYSVFYFAKIKRVPGLLTESVYNLGVALLTMRSIFIGVIDIYGTDREGMVVAYLIIAIICLVAGLILYIIGLVLHKSKESK